jgi:hypothetical protein
MIRQRGELSCREIAKGSGPQRGETREVNADPVGQVNAQRPEPCPASHCSTTCNAPGHAAHLRPFPTIRPKELRELLDEYGVPAAEQQTLLRLAARQHTPDRLDADTSTLPEEVTEYFGLEPVATQIMIYEAHAVPALLRTTPYAHVIAETRPRIPAS